MPHIISASRRTDIPAFFSPWLMRRLQAGYCEWVQPFNGRMQKVSLLPEDCLALAFWTRNPGPLLPHLPAIRKLGHACYFHFTINGYAKSLESHNPPVEVAVDKARELAEVLGPDAVCWRYDPIILSSQTPVDYHRQRFAELAKSLQGVTRHCTLSFLDMYGKTKRNMQRLEREQGLQVQAPDLPAQRALTHELRDIAQAHGMQLFSCCEDGLVGDGVQKSRCIDLARVMLVRGQQLGESSPPAHKLKARPTRQDCGCVQSVDIGAYDTCRFGCVYCYATNSRQAAAKRAAEHDPCATSIWRPKHKVDRVEVRHAET